MLRLKKQSYLVMKVIALIRNAGQICWLWTQIVIASTNKLYQAKKQNPI